MILKRINKSLGFRRWMLFFFYLYFTYITVITTIYVTGNNKFTFAWHYILYFSIAYIQILIKLHIFQFVVLLIFGEKKIESKYDLVCKKLDDIKKHYRIK